MKFEPPRKVFRKYFSATPIFQHASIEEVAFIAKTWPKATIVPIILKSKVTRSESEKLGLLLAQKLPENTLVLASVDFSHYLPELAADFHDETSEEVILAKAGIPFPQWGGEGRMGGT